MLQKVCTVDLEVVLSIEVSSIQKTVEPLYCGHFGIVLNIEVSSIQRLDITFIKMKPCAFGEVLWAWGELPLSLEVVCFLSSLGKWNWGCGDQEPVCVYFPS